MVGLILLVRGVIAMRKRCSNCDFGDVCKSRGVCAHYSTISSEIEESEIEELAVVNRYPYYEAWLEYISEDTPFDLSG